MVTTTVKRWVCITGLLVSAAAHAGKPADEIGKLVDLQIQGWSKDVDQAPDEAALYANARFTVTGDAALDDQPDVSPGNLQSDVVASMGIIDRKLTNRVVTMSHDGKTAWVSFAIWMKVDNSADGEKMIFERSFRVTEIAVATTDGWRLAGGTWTSPQDNAQINKEALAGKPRKLAELPKQSESKTLLDAFTAMLTTSSPTTAKDLVVIGSAPGERTVGGDVFSRGWDAAWRGHVAVIGEPTVRLAPSGTTGWVIANVTLTKKAAKPYTIPFRAFFVFDQATKGVWTLAHAHFAVGPH